MLPSNERRGFSQGRFKLLVDAHEKLCCELMRGRNLLILIANLHRYVYSAADPVDKNDPTGLFSVPELTFSVTINNILNEISLTHVEFSGFTTYVVVKTFRPGFEAINLAIELASRCSGPNCVLVATQLYQRGNALIALGSAQVTAIGQLTQNAKALQSLGNELVNVWNAADSLVRTGTIVASTQQVTQFNSSLQTCDPLLAACRAMEAEP